MKVIFMGTPRFSEIILDYLIKEKYNIPLVITKEDMPMGRKRVLTPQKLKVFAINQGLKVLTPKNLSEVFSEIDKINPDIIITAAYGLMVPSYLLNKYHVINVHASLLPKYRGGAPIERAMINCDKKTGITIIRLIKKMDAGPIIAQEELKIDYNESKTILTEKLAHLGGKMLIKYLKNMKKYKEIEQNENKATYAYNITLKDRLLDFNMKTSYVIGKIKAMQDEPGAFFIHKGKNVKIINATKYDIIKEYSPGLVVLKKGMLLIKTKDSFISVLTLQEEGKKVMNIKDYLNGQKLFKDREIIKKE